MSERVLMVDDDQPLCEAIASAMARHGVDITWRNAYEEGLALLEAGPFDAVLLDLHLPDTDGMALCGQIAARWPDLPIVVLTAFGSIERTVRAIRAGAYDFVQKPIEPEDLALVLGRASEHGALRREVKELHRIVREAHRFDEIVGSSHALQAVTELVAQVAETDATVLITGESGTGKELVARAIHRRSRRADGPFVGLSCPAIPETLLEAELFGHAKGAFTDARLARKGVLLRASGGTLLLDEIGDMPLAMQSKLLRALEERTVRPLGEEAEISFDTRVIAATNRDLEDDVKKGRFREDLYWRIHVVRIRVPPLRERGNDVLPLAQHFLETFAASYARPVRGLSPAAAERLLAWSWPGNVRELRNCIERAIAVTQGPEISVDDLPETVRAATALPRPAAGLARTEELLPLATVAQRHIDRVLDAVGGNRTRAAKILGVDRRTLQRRLESTRAPEQRQSGTALDSQGHGVTP